MNLDFTIGKDWADVKSKNQSHTKITVFHEQISKVNDKLNFQILECL